MLRLMLKERAGAAMGEVSDMAANGFYASGCGVSCVADAEAGSCGRVEKHAARPRDRLLRGGRRPRRSAEKQPRGAVLFDRGDERSDGPDNQRRDQREYAASRASRARSARPARRAAAQETSAKSPPPTAIESAVLCAVSMGARRAAVTNVPAPAPTSGAWTKARQPADQMLRR